ncbi:MAG: hypothetical protein PHG75_02900, partial [Syntrophomonas sp.]|nr:hypothetical protein [Syntrophomonas sp.]
TAAEVAAFPLAGLPVGSTFFESDTGILKVLNAAGALVQAPGETVALSGSNALKGATATVTTAGTEVQLPNYACREVTIIAKRANTGYIYIGGSDVSSTVYGAELAAKESITLAVNNTNLVYIDSSVNGEGISYVAI